MHRLRATVPTLLILAVAVSGCDAPDAEAGAVGAPAAAAGDAPAPPVPDAGPVTATTGEPLRTRLVAESRITTEWDVDIAAGVTGKIVEVHVDRGKRVRKGQILAEFDRRKEELFLEAATAELEHVKAQEISRRELHADKHISNELLREAETDLEWARARKEMAEHEVERKKVRAPFAGEIIHREAREGMYVEKPEMALFRISGDGPLEATAYLSEWAVPYLREGSPVTVHPVYGGSPLAARLHWLSPVVDPVAGTVEARVRLAPGQAVRRGAAVELEFVLVSDPELPTVPRDSLLEPDPEPGAQAALMVRGAGGAWERTTVRLGLVGATRVEVRKGLDPGAEVRPGPAGRD